MAASSKSDPLDSVFAPLAEACRALAVITDDLAGEVSRRQERLQALKVPFEAWVTIQSEEYEHETSDEDSTGTPVMEDRSDDLELGWTRDVRSWVLAVRECTHKNLRTNWMRRDVGESIRLLEAPREQQILALEHFGKLVQALTSRAKQAVEKVTKQ
jgi:hypothetical protein